MRNPKPPGGREPSAALAALLFVALAACALSPAAAAQSGRRKPGSPPTPTTGGTGTTGESKPEARKAAPLASLVLMSDFTASYDIDTYTRRIVEDGFANRLGGVNGLSLTRAGRGSRKDARDRAKNETEAYVVWVQMEKDSFQNGQIVVNSPDLAVKYNVFEPRTGDAKAKGKVFYQAMAGPRGRAGSSDPVKITAEAAGIEAAERVMDWFVLVKNQPQP
jgi:hypothetical protein